MKGSDLRAIITPRKRAVMAPHIESMITLVEACEQRQAARCWSRSPTGIGDPRCLCGVEAEAGCPCTLADGQIASALAAVHAVPAVDHPRDPPPAPAPRDCPLDPCDPFPQTLIVIGETPQLGSHYRVAVSIVTNDTGARRVRMVLRRDGVNVRKFEITGDLAHYLWPLLLEAARARAAHSGAPDTSDRLRFASGMIGQFADMISRPEHQRPTVRDIKIGLRKARDILMSVLAECVSGQD